MDTKKIFIFALILLILGGATILVYNLYFKAPAPPKEPAGASNNAGDSLPNAGADAQNGAASPQLRGAQTVALKIKPISQEKVFGATIGADGKTVKYYSRENGNLFESDFDGDAVKKISSVSLKNIIKIIWSPDKNRVVGVFSQENKVKKYFYDYTTNQTAQLNQNIGYVSWSRDSRQIIYQFTDKQTDKNTISVANPDGASWKDVLKTRLDDLIIEWPAKNKVSLQTKPSGLSGGLLAVFDPALGDFKTIISDSFGLSAKWSPIADKFIYSSTSAGGKNPKISLADANGQRIGSWFENGLADKCVWSSDNKTIFCALPQEISQSAVWPDDYYKGLVVLADDFYKINLETGARTKIAPQLRDAAGYDAQDLFLSPQEDRLFFVNKKDGLLYGLKTQ